MAQGYQGGPGLGWGGRVDTDFWGEGGTPTLYRGGVAEKGAARSGHLPYRPHTSVRPSEPTCRIKKVGVPEKRGHTL